MQYDDLLNIPFKLNGRDKTGLDCYGLVLEMCKRAGTPLVDIGAVHEDKSSFDNDVKLVNLEEISETQAAKGDVIQCIYDNEIHIAYMLDKGLVIHSTVKGVRITPVFGLRNKKYFRVTKCK